MRLLCIGLIALGIAVPARGATWRVQADCLSHALRQTLDRASATKSYKLFPKGDYSPVYDLMLERIKKGDTVRLGDGVEYKIIQRLGEGEATVVFDIGNGEALRLPKHSNRPLSANDKFSSWMYESSMNDFVEIQAELKKNGVPVIDYSPVKSRPPHYLIVKKEEFHFTLDGFFKKTDMQGKPLVLSEAEYQKVLKQAKEFARKTWMYRSIGDLAPRNIGYNGQEFLAFDFSRGLALVHKPITELSDPGTIFTPVEGYTGSTYGRNRQVVELLVPNDFRLEVEKEILEHRAQEEKTGRWIERTSQNADAVVQRAYLVKTLVHEPIPSGTELQFRLPKDRSKQKGGIAGVLTQIDGGQSKIKMRILGPATSSIAAAVDKHGLATVYRVQLKNGQTALLKILRKDDQSALQQFQKEVLQQLDSSEDQSGPHVYASGFDFILTSEP